ncbi:hypothetical protein C2E23DRAFT_723862 [Lenzites betulinus]|nr:hypothetical protein C2E23DRAFT_723862 [Lenzites betulinus]
MPAIVRLPLELLSHIVSYLGDDHDALRALCLSNQVLHAVSFPLLFSVRGFRRLGAPYLKPLLRHLSELRIAWKPDMHGGRDAEVLARFLAPYLSVEEIPRLQKVTIRGINVDGMSYLNTIGNTLKTLTSLTSLHLNETYHKNLRDVQLLIHALPHLTHLYMNAVTWTNPEFNTCGEDCDLLGRPELKYLCVSPVYPSCTLPVLDWLARTPSARSLRTLDVPMQARIGPEALARFGPSVYHVLVPLSGLQPGKSMQNYVSLTKLTLYVRIDDVFTRNYERLPDLIAALPSPSKLRELEMHVPHEAAVKRARFLDPFSRLDDILFCHTDSATTELKPSVAMEPDSPCTPRRFDAFVALRVVLLTVRMPDPEEREATDWAVRLHMPRAATLGRLSVQFQQDARYALVLQSPRIAQLISRAPSDSQYDACVYVQAGYYAHDDASLKVRIIIS